MHLRSDRRSQSIQIGAVILFGVLIVLLSSYQAFVVPSQNEEVEFNHHQAVERDMVEMRAQILQAKTTGEDRFTTVQLGTEFSSRIIARNPPDPSGTLRTTDNRTLQANGTVDGEIQNMTDWFREVVDENRFITYSPTYSEYHEGGTIRYENTVVYKEFDDANVMASDQRLIQNDTISLIPVHRQFEASGGQQASVEPIPSVTQTQKGVENPNITLGTELTEEDWVNLFEDEIEDGLISEDDISVTTENGEQVLKLDLEGTFDIEYAPVGLDQSPFAVESVRGAQEINPAAPGDIALVDSYYAANESLQIARFENLGAENTTIIEARINFYDSANSQGNRGFDRADFGTPPPLDSNGYLDWGPDQPNAVLKIGDFFKTVDPEITIGEGELGEVLFHFNEPGQQGPDLDETSWYVVTLVFDSGESGTYFVSVSEEQQRPYVETVDAEAKWDDSNDQWFVNLTGNLRKSGYPHKAAAGNLDSVWNNGDVTLDIEYREVGSGDSWSTDSSRDADSLGEFNLKGGGNLNANTVYEVRAYAQGNSEDRGVIITIETGDSDGNPP